MRSLGGRSSKAMATTCGRAGGVGWIWGGWEWVWFEGEGLAQNLTTQQRARGITANSACAAVPVVVEGAVVAATFVPVTVVPAYLRVLSYYYYLVVLPYPAVDRASSLHFTDARTRCCKNIFHLILEVVCNH